MVRVTSEGQKDGELLTQAGLGWRHREPIQKCLEIKQTWWLEGCDLLCLRHEEGVGFWLSCPEQAMCAKGVSCLVATVLVSIIEVLGSWFGHAAAQQRVRHMARGALYCPQQPLPCDEQRSGEASEATDNNEDVDALNWVLHFLYTTPRTTPLDNASDICLCPPRMLA